jgi:NADH:ubiquinone oxidoreductase subunit 3 (subunit A)
LEKKSLAPIGFRTLGPFNQLKSSSSSSIVVVVVVVVVILIIIITTTTTTIISTSERRRSRLSIYPQIMQNTRKKNEEQDETG